MKLLVLILSVMFAYPAFGAAGDACNIADTRTWMEGDCMLLCDGSVTKADGDCTSGGNGILVGYGRHRRIRSLAIELHDKGTCTAGDVKVYSRSIGVTCATCPWHHIATLDLSATDDAGVSLIEINGIGAAPMPYVNAVISSSAGCSATGPTILIHRRGALEND